MRLSLGIAAVAATFVGASPALAQNSVTAQGSAQGTVIVPLTLTNTQALDFGTVISGNTAGTVSINANNSARAVSGGVTGVATYPGTRGTFVWSGTSGQAVTLSYTPAVVLSNGAATINGTLVLDSSNSLTRTVDGTGQITVGVGGTFNLAANQANGVYTTSYNLTAQYP